MLILWVVLCVLIVLIICAVCKVHREHDIVVDTFDGSPDTHYHPISFAYPTTKAEQYRWCRTVQKEHDFSNIIPGQTRYAFTREHDYMEAYSKCYFAITMKKGGWDCLRHYEILAAGCIPYFIDLDSLPNGTMHNFPTKLIKQSMELPGVPRNIRPGIDTAVIDWDTFSISKYEQCRKQILHYFDAHLLTVYLPRHLNLNVKRVGIRCLKPWNYVDYMRDLLCIGILDNSIHLHVEHFDIDYIFEDTTVQLSSLYGRGMTIGRSIPATKRKLYHYGDFDVCDVIILATQSNFGVNLQKTVPGKRNIIVDGNDIVGAHPQWTADVERVYVRELRNQ
tara:strand:+ start:249 stop:1253 length:1005 start_codon:yes stop_codon:yes gene_type:complete